MNVLRILVTTPVTADRAMHWSLHDISGACMEAGRSVPSDWPAADRVEAVVAASQVRLASVMLPPLPPARIAAAAAFALEDRLATTGEAPALAVSSQRGDGRVVVAIVDRSLLASFLSSNNAVRSIPIVRAVAEPELATPGPGWCWCAPDDEDEGEGFVRLADGSAFPVSATPVDGSLPAELALALAHAARSGTTPAQVRVDASVSDEALVHWQSDTGVAFVRGAAWQWNAAPLVSVATATNLLQGEFAAGPPRRAGDRMRSFKVAAVIALAALGLHVAATIGEWAWWRIDAWRATRGMRSLALSAGASESEAATPEDARAALAKRYADQRHAHRLAAPGDALLLLARAAPALAATPPGLLKSATYADGHWTLDLQRADAAVVRDLDMRLRRAGAPATTAVTGSGARVRFGSE